MKRRILINRTNETVLRFLPPYIIRQKHVDEVIRELDSALRSAASDRVTNKNQESIARSRN
jgi:acetylornithine aminotransferase/acetylornithine/N-succinyldiaminopimelate aminotransferase